MGLGPWPRGSAAAECVMRGPRIGRTPVNRGTHTLTHTLTHTHTGLGGEKRGLACRGTHQRERVRREQRQGNALHGTRAPGPPRAPLLVPVSAALRRLRGGGAEEMGLVPGVGER